MEYGGFAVDFEEMDQSVTLWYWSILPEDSEV